MNIENHLPGLFGDLRFAARSLRRTPGFGATTIVSLALGVALTASTLAVMNSYVMRAMPFQDSERLYRALYDFPASPSPAAWSASTRLIKIPTRLYLTSTPPIDVFAARTAAQVDVLPLGITGSSLSSSLLLLGRERLADGRDLGLAQQRDVVLQPAPLAVALQTFRNAPTSMLPLRLLTPSTFRLAWRPSIVWRVMVDSMTSLRRSFTIANRSTSNATVPSRFAVARFAASTHRTRGTAGWGRTSASVRRCAPAR